MSQHLVETILINLPITTASERFWQLLQSSNQFQPFNHYFTTTNIFNSQQNSFQRTISLRLLPLNNKNQLNPEGDQFFSLKQQVIKQQKTHKFIYSNLPHQSQLSQTLPISGSFAHYFQQNSKGQTYFVFTSSLLIKNNPIPQKSQAQIELIKIKDLLENHSIHKKTQNNTLFPKCC